MERLWKVTEATKLITIYEDKCTLADKGLVKKYATILLNNPDEWEWQEYHTNARKFIDEITESHLIAFIIKELDVLDNITDEEKEDFKYKVYGLDLHDRNELYAEYKLLSKLRKLDI